MTRPFARWLFLLGTILYVFGGADAYWQSRSQVAISTGGTCTGPGLALDGSAHGSTSGSFLIVPLTTTTANDIIVVFASVNGAPVTGITSSGLSFSKRGAGGISPNQIEEWFAVSSGVLTAATIRVDQTTPAFMTLDIFGISGANTVSTFDGSVVTGSADPLSITTSFANTMIIGGFRSTISVTTQGAGYTLISGIDFAMAEYKVASSAQTGLSVSMGTGVGTSNGAVADAVKCI